MLPDRNDGSIQTAASFAALIGCSLHEQERGQPPKAMTTITPTLSADAADLSDTELAHAAFTEVDEALARAGGEYMSKVRLFNHVVHYGWRNRQK